MRKTRIISLLLIASLQGCGSSETGNSNTLTVTTPTSGALVSDPVNVTGTCPAGDIVQISNSVTASNPTNSTMVGCSNGTFSTTLNYNIPPNGQTDSLALTFTLLNSSEQVISGVSPVTETIQINSTSCTTGNCQSLSNTTFSVTNPAVSGNTTSTFTASGTCASNDDIQMTNPGSPYNPAFTIYAACQNGYWTENFTLATSPTTGTDIVNITFTETDIYGNPISGVTPVTRSLTLSGSGNPTSNLDPNFLLVSPAQNSTETMGAITVKVDCTPGLIISATANATKNTPVQNQNVTCKQTGKASIPLKFTRSNQNEAATITLTEYSGISVSGQMTLNLILAAKQ